METIPMSRLVAPLSTALFAVRVMLAFAAPWLFAAAALAVDGETASGEFRSQTVTMPVKSAVAFRGKSSVGDGDAVIVAVFSTRVNAAAIADYVDRRRVIEKRVKGGEVGVVYFEFRSDGAYQGLSYFFGSGNGCEFCPGAATSTVKRADGRLAGRLQGADKERSFDIALDTPVLTDAHGAPLPIGGGAPGSAYLAYHKALAQADRAELHRLLSQDQQDAWAKAEKNASLGKFLHALSALHPAKSVEITQGFDGGDKAVLIITGESTGGKVAGEVLLLRQDGTWRVDDEVIERVAR
jgi:hypothetical protein